MVKILSIRSPKSCLAWASIVGVSVLLVASLGWSQEKATDHGYLGVYLKNMDAETREAMKIKDEGGALVDGVVDEGPADEAGIKDGDVILRFNDKTFKDESELRDLIMGTKPDDKVTVVVWREGSKRSFNIVMGKASETAHDITVRKMISGGPGTMKGMGCCGGSECGVWLGVEVQKLGDQLAEYFKVKDGQGALVASVAKDSPAEKAGLKAGDVILKVGDAAVEKRADLREAICGKKAGDDVSVEISRDGVKKSLRVTLAEAPEDYREKHSMMGRAFGWMTPEDLDFDLEEIGPEVGERIKELRIQLDQPVNDLQEQIEELRGELEKLKARLDNK